MDRRGVLAAAAGAALFTSASGTSATARSRARAASAAELAPSPPMGWNSWNSFATAISERQALETAEIMREKLAPAGYNIFTIDHQWYEPSASSYQYPTHPTPELDGNGRLVPAPNRFPSGAGGKGFAPLAAQVHGMGLKFGIHLMRGIARRAVELNLPVLGTDYRARDIADPSSVCSWNVDMYGVDMSKPGAQAYYDSVFRLYAGWGVDFIKMDDMSRPYDAHAPEIEAAHKAIQASGRPIVLSLSPGETPVLRADHVAKYAQMWRISDDFWDEWGLLEAQFGRLENWNPYRAPGSWPDADMLPLGRLALGARDSRFTADEQRTVMTLWSIARSPLIMGGDLRHLDQATLDLLTNPEVIAVNQASTDNRPHFLEDGVRVWSARPADGRGRYVALFNLGNAPRPIRIKLGAIGAEGSVMVRDLWKRDELGRASKVLEAVVPAHGAHLYRLTA